MALRSVSEAESLLALVLKPGSLDGLYQDLDSLLASTANGEASGGPEAEEGAGAGDNEEG
ncbi:MAG: hypothetical protein ACKOH7_07980 [Solirubrobacterales bacterium]